MVRHELDIARRCLDALVDAPGGYAEFLSVAMIDKARGSGGQEPVDPSL
jgi:hypothetical protein